MSKKEKDSSAKKRYHISQAAAAILTDNIQIIAVATVATFIIVFFF